MATKSLLDGIQDPDKVIPIQVAKAIRDADEFLDRPSDLVSPFLKAKEEREAEERLEQHRLNEDPRATPEHSLFVPAKYRDATYVDALSGSIEAKRAAMDGGRLVESLDLASRALEERIIHRKVMGIEEHGLRSLPSLEEQKKSLASKRDQVSERANSLEYQHGVLALVAQDFSVAIEELQRDFEREFGRRLALASDMIKTLEKEVHAIDRDAATYLDRPLSAESSLVENKRDAMRSRLEGEDLRAKLDSLCGRIEREIHQRQSQNEPAIIKPLEDQRDAVRVIQERVYEKEREFKVQEVNLTIEENQAILRRERDRGQDRNDR